MAFENDFPIIKDDVIRILADNFIDIDKDVKWADLSYEYLFRSDIDSP
jgi:hypothetical protein